MTTTLERITNTPIVYEIDATALTAKVQQFADLTIAGVNDVKGYKAVSEARKELKRDRVAIENHRKKLKADALDYGRKVDAVAKELTALIEPTERKLLAEEERIDAERQRIRAEAEAKVQAEFDARIRSLIELGMTPVSPSEFHPDRMSEEEFQSNLADAREEARIIAEKKAAEEAARKAEQERIAAEEAERRRIEEAKLAEERERLRVEREETEAKLAAQREQLRKDREAQEAEERRIREERAKLEAEQRAKLEAEAAERRAKEKADRDAAEKARREALRPDREKLLSVVEQIRAIVVPEVSAEAEWVAQIVRQGLHRSAGIIEESINKSLPA